MPKKLVKSVEESESGRHRAKQANNMRASETGNNNKRAASPFIASTHWRKGIEKENQEQNAESVQSVLETAVSRVVSLVQLVEQMKKNKKRKNQERRARRAQPSESFALRSFSSNQDQGERRLENGDWSGVLCSTEQSASSVLWHGAQLPSSR